MTSTRTAAVVAMGIAIAAGGPASAIATGASPETVVRELNAGLLAVMKESDRLGYDGRVERVAPIVDAAFDVPFMAEKSLGREWKKLDEDTRTEWVGLFREFMIANYAGRFAGYSGQAFEELGREEGAYDTVMVKTRLVDPGDENVDLDYRLRQTDDQGWRVVDVYLKGSVSELALRRSDYTAVVKRGGYEELATYLRGKIEALKSGTAE